MTFEIASHFKQLTPDPWRQNVGFSESLGAAHKILFEHGVSDNQVIEVLNEWLQRNQPCVFGRIAAKLGFIEHCILRDSDLLLSDEEIQQKIQVARLRWLKKGYDGQKSNFIILVVSPTLSFALPNETVGKIAQRLCSLYLQIDAKFDFIHYDQIFLEKPGPGRLTWRWLAGVNYFCAQGDLRWWQDHRIPGGLGFSVNSVGHLVKSEKVSRLMAQLNEQIGGSNEELWTDSKVDSLGKALVLAMQTISNASDSVSGRATELLPANQNPEFPKCPVTLPHALSGKNHCQYVGYYHTDYTLPSEYFQPDEHRPESVEPFLLDFTYLFHRHVDNPDHWTMGEGQRIRRDVESRKKIERDDEFVKQKLSEADTMSVSDSELLVRAIDSG